MTGEDWREILRVGQRAADASAAATSGEAAIASFIYTTTRRSFRRGRIHRIRPSKVRHSPKRKKCTRRLDSLVVSLSIAQSMAAITDWPHPQWTKRMMNDAEEVELLYRYVDGDTTLVRKILVDNPARLYEFVQ